MVELVLAVLGLVASGVFYSLGERNGRRSEAAIRGEVAAVPERTAQAVTTMFEEVAEPPTSQDPNRGWQMQVPATFGLARILPDTEQPALLVEFPYGAHSTILLILNEDRETGQLQLRDVARNGTGTRFHVREASGASEAELVTVDYVRPLRDDRAMANMPIQPVYYRVREHGLEEIGRGEIYDPEDDAWNIPPSVEPFLDPAWVREKRGA